MSNTPEKTREERRIALAKEIDSDKFKNLLLEGNNIYRQSKKDQIYTSQETTSRLDKTKKEQKPFAIVLSCADSRVPPELLFDLSIGDLFVVRVAGNIVSSAAFASIDFAVNQLKVKNIIILGHEGCGAVQNASKESNPKFSTTLNSLLYAISWNIGEKTGMDAIMQNVSVTKNMLYTPQFWQQLEKQDWRAGREQEAEQTYACSDSATQIKYEQVFEALNYFPAVYHLDGTVSFLNDDEGPDKCKTPQNQLEG